jgi:dolichol kinase
LGASFWIFQLVKFSALGLVAYITGRIAQKGLLRVNYTRKINHFAISFLPDWISTFFVHSSSNLMLATGALVSFSYFFLFLKPIRSRISLFSVMFAAINRPEDRPHTLFWFISQYAAAIMVMIPMYLYFQSQKLGGLALIPLLINNIGDGLAEPVGVRFGKHRYRTRGFLVSREYTRSLEGSLCILITGILIVLAYHSFFNPAQLIAAVITVPLIMTLAEAFSPHTWDAPFLILSGGLALAIIKKAL